MAENIQPSAGVEAPAQAHPSLAEAGQRSPESSPQRSTAEAVGSGDRDPFERIQYLEKEQKKLIEERDKFKQRFLDSNEGKDLIAKAQRLDQLEKERTEAERKAAEERGEWKRLHDEEKTKREALERDWAESRRRQSLESLKNAALTSYQSVNGVDSETFGLLVDKAIAEGLLKTNDDGKPEGVREFLQKVAEGKPFLFQNQQDALRRVSSSVEGGPLRAAQQALGQRNMNPSRSGRTYSLCDPPTPTKEMESTLATRANSGVFGKDR